MIKTFYGLGTLDTPAALFTALALGFFFGLALERAGFGSSRRLAGIFYFRDMAVLKVMFTALVTAMIGLSLFIGLGLIDPATQIYFMTTYYGAYIVAGLIFGVGFVMSGWCPGTAAVGLASGRLDALVFLGGAVVGSILFNELFPIIKPLYTWGQSTQKNFGQPGLAFVHTSLGISKSAFALIFTLVAVGCFWGAEYVERLKAGKEGGPYFRTPFLRAFSLCLVVSAGTLLFFSAPRAGTPEKMTAAEPSQPAGVPSSPGELLASVEAAQDHVEPEELAAALYNADPGLMVVDVRPAEEYDAFHIRGAVNVQLSDLPGFMARHRDADRVVLYSNGMTHPAQARDALFRMGYGNVYILTDGLNGFLDYCLKPVSLRSLPLPPEIASQINAWRAYFYGEEVAPPADMAALPDNLPGLVDTAWLAANLGKTGVRVIDCRDQPEYNRGHIPGALAVNCESFRGAVDGVPSVLLPAPLLAAKFSLLGIVPTDMVVLVYGGDRVRDATLIAMALERLGHTSYGILDGGFDRWQAETRPTDTALPEIIRSRYPVPAAPDSFTVGYQQVLACIRNKDAVVLDTRPADYFSGQKSDEARAGHMPGAVNRPYKDDLTGSGLRAASELEAVYARLIPSKDSPVIVHCRTGHQASQTYFVLTRLLGYKKVYWYDAGWTEWAARKTLPLETGTS